jgi:hypothetical protein
MKKIFFTLLFFNFGYAAFSQELSEGTYEYDNKTHSLVIIKNPETIEVTLIKKQGSIKQTGMAEMRIAPRYSDTPGKTWYEFSTNACNYDFDISKNTLVLSAFDCKKQVKDFKLVFTRKSFKRPE